MPKLSSLKTNVVQEEEGVWVPYAQGIQLRIARYGNRSFKARMERLTKPHLRQIRKNSFPEEEAQKFLNECLAHHVLLGWKGLDGENGKPLKYTPDEALKILSDPEYQDFYNDVVELSKDRQLFKEQDMQDAEGNSKQS